jgi:uncharacterized protein
MRMSVVLAAVLLLVISLHAGAQDRAGQPLIIDMHLHASPADANGPPPLGLCLPLTSHLLPLDPARQTFSPVSKQAPCSDPIWSPMTDEAVMKQTIEVLKRRNIVGVLSGSPDRVLQWSKEAPDHFIRSVEFRLGPDQLSVDELRRLFKEGSFAVLGEVSNQYAGIAPDDPRMEPYWALAELLDVPVAIHMGEGPPGAAYLIPTYRARLTSPYLLEEVLSRHPRLRVSVMHYGSPLIEEMIAMLGAYPQLYVDIGGIQWNYPRAYFYKQLKELTDAGFGKRIMFGSDQMTWPA